MPPAVSAVLVAKGHEIRESPRDLGVSEHREYFLRCLDHRLVRLVCYLVYLLLLRPRSRRSLIVVDENSVRGSGSSERAVDVDEVLDLGEMSDPCLDVTIEVRVNDDPADAVSEGAFIVGRDGVSGKVVIENRSSFTDEVGGTRDVAPGGLREAATSELSASVDHCEYMRNCSGNWRKYLSGQWVESFTTTCASSYSCVGLTAHS